jgi:adenylate kinase
MLGRVQSEATGKTYNLTLDPPPASDPGPFVRRTDDTADDILRRLEIYHQRTEPLKRYYAERGLLTAVDAGDSIDAVTELILQAVSPDPP